MKIKLEPVISMIFYENDNPAWCYNDVENVTLDTDKFNCTQGDFTIGSHVYLEGKVNKNNTISVDGVIKEVAGGARELSIEM